MLSFLAMEFNAWWLHRFVMHGPLWMIHQDHHEPNPHSIFQRNDFFALIFAIPSFLFILFDSVFAMPLLGAIGFGVMAYGVSYFLVHEVIIHRRFKFLGRTENWYLRALVIAHRVHHSRKDKYGCQNFGMLVVSPQYLRQARRLSLRSESDGALSN